MHSIKEIRENPVFFDEALCSRKLFPMSCELLKFDAAKRDISQRLQQLQCRRNELASLVGMAKKNKEDCSNLEQEALNIRQSIQSMESDESDLEKKLNDLLSEIPNLPLGDVPVGADEAANVCIKIEGEPRRFDFRPKPHYEIGEERGLIDFQSAAKISGSRFVVLKGAIAKLERALKNFMLDCHTREFGYVEMSVPFVVKQESMYGTAQLPKFAGDSFVTTDERWLIPTAEVPLTNMVRDSVIALQDLPIRMTAYSACFRSEAGSAGKDTRGMIRNHQFSKVELVSVVHPDEGENELDRMLSAAENILKKLKIPYRVMLLSTGDMGFSAQKTYDIEVWIPSENTYREISSCSLCGQFQARRMSARYKGDTDKGFVATLNGSGLAIGRTIVAILENYQTPDGKIIIPDVLVSYMDGEKEI